MDMSIDTGILYGIQDVLRNPVFDAFFPYFTWLGEFGALWIVVGLALTFSRKWRFWGICMLVSIACVGLINELGLKNLIARTRPYIVENFPTIHFFPPTSYSFPSGHAACAFAAATIVTLSPAKRYWKALVCVIAILIAFSRLYLFVHYPTDVLAGAIVGTILALIVVLIAKRIRERRNASSGSGKHAAI